MAKKSKRSKKKQSDLARWLRLRDEMRALLEDPETTQETLSAWEDVSGVLTNSQEQRLRRAVRMAERAVSGTPHLRKDRVAKALHLMAPAAADRSLPEGSWVAVIRSRHGWHDYRVQGVYRNGEVTDAEGVTYQIAHPRDVRLARRPA